MDQAKKLYFVMDTLLHNGQKYFPEGENNQVELTDSEAAPLLISGVLAAEAVEGETNTSNTEHDVLIGSSEFNATIDLIDNTQIQLGDLVAQTHASSGLSVADWNALEQADRDAKLNDQLALLNKPPAPEERVNLIKQAIAGLDKENKGLFTKDGVTPKTDAIAAVTGWPVSAEERNAVLKAAAE